MGNRHGARLGQLTAGACMSALRLPVAGRSAAGRNMTRFEFAGTRPRPKALFMSAGWNVCDQCAVASRNSRADFVTKPCDGPVLDKVISTPLLPSGCVTRATDSIAMLGLAFGARTATTELIA